MKPFCKEFLLEYPPPPHCFAFLPYSWRGARDPSRACFIAGMQSEWHPNLRDQLSCINRVTLTPAPRRERFSFQPMLFYLVHLTVRWPWWSSGTCCGCWLLQLLGSSRPSCPIHWQSEIVYQLLKAWNPTGTPLRELREHLEPLISWKRKIYVQCDRVTNSCEFLPRQDAQRGGSNNVF